MSEITERLTPAIADRYRIEGELGQGGMAIVFQAHDMKHDRKVALKVLRPELAAVIGAERFLNEIKVTANLQHPHILPLHDSGEADSFLFYVMPYVEGDTLRDKLDKEKQLGIEDAIEITRSLAAALDYAHRQGVIHRDIKPENVLLHDGQALIADFGIALAISAAAGGTRLTETGLSIGTPQYMSPEQAMGDRELDARSDIYSLGAMLYEMLAGDPPYTGSTAQAIVAKVITEKAPPVTAARDTVPPHVAMAIGKALSKLPADRFSTAIRFAEALTNPGFSVSLAEATTVGGKRVSLWNPLSVAATVMAAVAVALAAWLATRPEPAKQVSRFVVNTGDVVMVYTFGGGTPARLSLTPDGSELLYVGDIPDDGRPASLLRRPLAQFTAQPIPGTESAFSPRVSPDGQHVAFVQRTSGGGALKVASLRGGPPVAVLDSISWRGDVAWGPSGYLYFFLDDSSTLSRISGSGGPIEQVVALQAGVPGASYGHPTILPNGRGAIVTVTSADPNEHWEYQVHLVDLTTGESREAVTGVYGAYAASGHLVYVTAEGTLMAAPLDMDAMVLSGPPVAMFDGVGTRWGGFVDLALSDNGTLAYTTQGTNISERVVWASRDGVTRPVDPAWVREDEFEGLALSPDGTKLAVEVVTDRRSDIWIKRLDEGPLSRLTFGGEDNERPVWTPDGASVTFLSRREGRWEVWTKRADGSGAAQRLVDLETSVREISWSPDADWLLLRMDEDIYAMRPDVDSMPSPLVATEFRESGAVLSPDGRWLAYVSNESGEQEIYLRPFPDVDQGRWQLSTAGGEEPMWSADGTMLYYRTDGRTIEEIDMRAGPSAATKVSTIHLPTQNVYEQNFGNVMYAVAPDGRFIVFEREGIGDVSGDLVIVQNFFEELKAKAGN
jgi:serine/threonine-protein kinase